MLKKIIVIVLGILVGVLGFSLGRLSLKNNLITSEKRSNKFCNYFKVLDQWLTLLENNTDIKLYFKNKGYHSVAIYGMGVLGKHLCKYLENSEVQIIYGIDQNTSKTNYDFPIYSLEHTLTEADAVIVTATFDFENIKHDLSSHISCPIISLEEILYEC